MNPPFRDLMAHATQLTRAGRLHDATAAIQAALRGVASPGAAPALPEGLPDDVVDVVAHEVDAASVRTAAGPELEGRFSAGVHAEPLGRRHYKLFVPPGADARALPLVVMLHGCTQNPDDFARGTRMNEAARSRGLLVLYPAQERSANSSGCWNWFKHNHQARGKGEPALLVGMVRAVMASHAVDVRRVYVAGLSAGGAMAAILGDAYPDVFAAVGVHSGLPTGSARDVQSAFAAMQGGAAATAGNGMGPPTIVFHGDQDTTVHPVNGERVLAACTRAGVVASERNPGEGGRAFTRRIHADPAGQVRAEHWTVHGAGHAWSGGSAQGTYTDASGPDATTEMLRFFLANPLPVGA